MAKYAMILMFANIMTHCNFNSIFVAYETYLGRPRVTRYYSGYKHCFVVHCI